MSERSYRINIDIQQLEIDQLLALVELSDLQDTFTDGSPRDIATGFRQFRDTLAQFVVASDGEPVSEAEQRAYVGRTRLNEIGSILEKLGGNLKDAAVPPPSASA